MGAVAWPRGMENWKFARRGRGHGGPVTRQKLTHDGAARSRCLPVGAWQKAKPHAESENVWILYIPTLLSQAIYQARREEQHQQNGGQRTVGVKPSS